MPSNKLSIFVVAISVIILFAAPGFALEGFEEDWWGSSDYAEDFINALGLNSYPDKLLKIGFQYYKNGDYDLAIKNLRESIKFYMGMESKAHPRLSAAYLILGKIYHKLARYDDAIYCLERAYYTYGYLYNLEALNLIEIMKKEKKKNNVDRLFARAKVVPKPAEEEIPEDQAAEPLEELRKPDFELPPELFEMAHFAFDSSVLTKTGREVLDIVASKLKDNPDIKIIIDGYCDSKGSVEYNLKLGQRRAKSARTYLVEVHNINSDRLITRSYGEQAPVDSNETDEGRAKNRRIQFTVLFPESPGF